MTTLGDNGEWALLHNLRQRFKADEIYTYAFASFFAAAAAAAIVFIPTMLGRQERRRYSHLHQPLQRSCRSLLGQNTAAVRAAMTDAMLC